MIYEAPISYNASRKMLNPSIKKNKKVEEDIQEDDATDEDI